MAEDKATGKDLPGRIPIFPLSGALLFPGGRLPLNIFEPRYLDMVRDAMAGDRIIGMVQPIVHERLTEKPEVYSIGCAGKITSFKESEDGRFQITLSGLSRFRIVEELSVTTKYRQVVPDWREYPEDLAGAEDDSEVDRERMMQALRVYLHMRGIKAEWKAIQAAPSGPLINYLSASCPFQTSEKQALLESPDLLERSRVFIALIEMSVLQGARGGTSEDDDDKPTVTH